MREGNIVVGSGIGFNIEAILFNALKERWPAGDHEYARWNTPLYIR